jgi:hypothetical protein
MIRRPTVVYIVILAALIGTYFYFKNREPAAADIAVTPGASEEVKYLFTAEDGIPTDIRIVAKSGETVEVARDANNEWVLHRPIEAKAEQGAAEAAASQVSTLRILDTVSNIDLDLAGVKVPEYLLNIKFSSGRERTIKIGVVTPSESGYYVQDAAGGDVQIVSKDALDALLGMLTSPPYLETLTPSPAVTETPIPPTETVPAPPTNETATPQT